MRTTCYALWVLGCLGLSASAQGAVPTAYGEEFVRQGQHWRDAGVAVTAAVEVSPQPRVEEVVPGDAGEFEAQLLAFEASGGPYSDSLAEPLAALGQYYGRRGDFEQARLMYARAVHVVRINDGLYSERQIPLVRELLSNLREAGDLEALDERYDYFFRLYGGGRAPFDALRVRASLEYLRWQREAVRLELDRGDDRRLLNLIQLNEDILEALSLARAAPYSWRRDLTLSQLRNLYLLRHRLEPKVQQLNAQKTIQHYVGGNSDPVDQQAYKLSALYRNATAQGRQAIQALLPLAVEQGHEELAALQLALADWQFWNGERGAKDLYRLVVQTLREAGASQLLETWLGEPVELPDNGAFWQPARSPALDRQLVSVRFDVTATGRARNIVSVAEQEGAPAASYLKRRLAAVRFRPRWQSGEPEAMLQLERVYEVFK